MGEGGGWAPSSSLPIFVSMHSEPSHSRRVPIFAWWLERFFFSFGMFLNISMFGGSLFMASSMAHLRSAADASIFVADRICRDGLTALTLLRRSSRSMWSLTAVRAVGLPVVALAPSHLTPANGTLLSLWMISVIFPTVNSHGEESMRFRASTVGRVGAAPWSRGFANPPLNWYT